MKKKHSTLTEASLLYLKMQMKTCLPVTLQSPFGLHSPPYDTVCIMTISISVCQHMVKMCKKQWSRLSQGLDWRVSVRILEVSAIYFLTRSSYFLRHPIYLPRLMRNMALIQHPHTRGQENICSHRPNTHTHTCTHTRTHWKSKINDHVWVYCGELELLCKKCTLVSEPE